MKGYPTVGTYSLTPPKALSLLFILYTDDRRSNHPKLVLIKLMDDIVLLCPLSEACFQIKGLFSVNL